MEVKLTVKCKKKWTTFTFCYHENSTTALAVPKCAQVSHLEIPPEYVSTKIPLTLLCYTWWASILTGNVQVLCGGFPEVASASLQGVLRSKNAKCCWEENKYLIQDAFQLRFTLTQWGPYWGLQVSSNLTSIPFFVGTKIFHTDLVAVWFCWCQFLTGWMYLSIKSTNYIDTYSYLLL